MIVRNKKGNRNKIKTNERVAFKKSQFHTALEDFSISLGVSKIFIKDMNGKEASGKSDCEGLSGHEN